MDEIALSRSSQTNQWSLPQHEHSDHMNNAPLSRPPSGLPHYPAASCNAAPSAAVPMPPFLSSLAERTTDVNVLHCALIVDGANLLRRYSDCFRSRAWLNYKTFEGIVDDVIDFFASSTGKTISIDPDLSVFVDTGPNAMYEKRRAALMRASQLWDHHRKLEQAADDRKMMTNFHRCVEAPAGTLYDAPGGKMAKRHEFQLRRVDVKRVPGPYQQLFRQVGGDLVVYDAMLHAAASESVDAVVLFSGDGDFVEAFLGLDKRTPHKEKKKLVAGFYNGLNHDLMRAADVDGRCALRVDPQSGRVWAEEWRDPFPWEKRLNVISVMYTLPPTHVRRPADDVVREGSRRDNDNKPPVITKRHDSKEEEEETDLGASRPGVHPFIRHVGGRMYIELLPVDAKKAPGPEFFCYLGK
ncbi:unnamed protein product [Vitrella brassicaformis CCMP3155]|uniref:NYN domain-containing protein n=2 Tax=Vitrella brassicaformis TaxID=1169539 RepID=A0A0G4GF72_VITBC|nr:unnamed protein product [Vitrella brassicaformis CCMP3155]|eukprot:CEM28171.1 unnamed protein product [Vitrella brassicaformis CCMP3155]